MIDRFLSIITFDEDAMRAAADDEALTSKVYFIFMAVALINTGLLFAFPEYMGAAELFSMLSSLLVNSVAVFAFLLVAYYVLMVAMVWAIAFAYSVVAGWFGGSGSPTQLFRVFGMIMPLGVLGALPVVGNIFTLWVIALDVFAIKVSQEISLGQSIGTFVVTVLLVVLLFMFLGLLVGLSTVASGQL